MEGLNLEIDVEQCRENDKVKEIISKSGLPIKYIKLLLRLSDHQTHNALFVLRPLPH